MFIQRSIRSTESCQWPRRHLEELSSIDVVRHKQYHLLWRFPIFILQLDNVLTYHVVSGNVQAADLKDGELIPTLVSPTYR